MSNTTNLKEKKEQLMTVEYEVDGNKIKLSPSIVQNYIVGSEAPITDQEYKFFVELCKARKLNPFLRVAYLIKYGNQPAQMVVGKDAILKRAILNPQFNGREQGIIVITHDDELVERKGSFKLASDELVGGWATVYRKDWEHPVHITVSFDEVAQRKRDGNLNSNWESKGATMVEKVALVRALREAFVEDLGGMIDADEAWSDTSHSVRQSQQEVVEQPEPTEIIDVETTEKSLDDL